MYQRKILKYYWAPNERKEQSFKIIPVRNRERQRVPSTTQTAAVYCNSKALRKDSNGRLNMILNSDIPRDLRLFILLDLKIVKILSKSQKQLSSRTFTAAWTTILRWGKLAGKVLQKGVSEMNKYGEYKALLKTKLKQWLLGHFSLCVYIYIESCL